MSIKVVLMCPHGRKINVKNTYGVTSYIHDDSGKECSVMNNLGFTSGKVMKTIETYNKPDIESKEKTMLFTHSPEVRWQEYDKIEACSRDKITQYVKLILRALDMASNTSNASYQMLVAELAETFGRALVDNIDICAGQRHDALARAVEKEAGKKPKRRMINLKNSYYQPSYTTKSKYNSHLLSKEHAAKSVSDIINESKKIQDGLLDDILREL